MANRKLTDDQVEDIRQRYRQRTTMRSLADEYGVGATTICAIVNGDTYRPSTAPARDRERARERRTAMPTLRRLDPGDPTEIRQRRAAGESIRSLARAFGVSSTVIYKLLRGETYRGAA